MANKTKGIGVRVDPEMDRRLERFERITDIGRVTLARAAIKAALDYFELSGKINFPLRVVDESSGGDPTTQSPSDRPGGEPDSDESAS